MARRVLTAALLALLLVTAGCAGTTATAQTDGSNGSSDVRTIDVFGQGTASAAGVSLSTLQSASTADVSYPRPVPFAMEATNADSGSRTVVAPGPVEVTSTVSVSYAVR